jgi:ribosomal protein S18 acetylase RimI-like enzyme
MAKIKIAKTTSDILVIEKLANTIWREHYIPIIGLDQVEYMLNKYQSFNSIRTQIDNRSFYYIIFYNSQPVGYLSFTIDKDALFLSKIYILKNFRGKNIGKAAMSFIEKMTVKSGLSKIVLTVNKNNINSIKAYEKLGFINTGSNIKDIGEGFIMDDYKMEKMIDRN